MPEEELAKKAPRKRQTGEVERDAAPNCRGDSTTVGSGQFTTTKPQVQVRFTVALRLSRSRRGSGGRVGGPQQYGEGILGEHGRSRAFCAEYPATPS